MENEFITFLEKIIKERDLYLMRGMELSKYPQQSNKIDELSAALSQAQGEFPRVTKDTKGYGYKYADLANILSLVAPILSKHGLYLTQYNSRKNILHTRIGHSSGQWIESQFEIPIPTEEKFGEMGKKTSYMQEIGARKTYSRRYEALAILGINPQGDDNDANDMQSTR